MTKDLLAGRPLSFRSIELSQPSKINITTQGRDLCHRHCMQSRLPPPQEQIPRWLPISRSISFGRWIKRTLFVGGLCHPHPSCRARLPPPQEQYRDGSRSRAQSPLSFESIASSHPPLFSLSSFYSGCDLKVTCGRGGWWVSSLECVYNRPKPEAMHNFRWAFSECAKERVSNFQDALKFEE